MRKNKKSAKLQLHRHHLQKTRGNERGIHLLPGEAAKKTFRKHVPEKSQLRVIAFHSQRSGASRCISLKSSQQSAQQTGDGRLFSSTTVRNNPIVYDTNTAQQTPTMYVEMRAFYFPSEHRPILFAVHILFAARRAVFGSGDPVRFFAVDSNTWPFSLSFYFLSPLSSDHSLLLKLHSHTYPPSYRQCMHFRTRVAVVRADPRRIPFVY